MDWKKILHSAWFPYCAPFAIYVLLIEPARYLPDRWAELLYIFKIFGVAFLLWQWRSHYLQDFAGKSTSRDWMVSIFAGVLVLVLWVLPEGRIFQLEQKTVFDPFALGNTEISFWFLVGIHLLGSSVVVPVMEELFWRSFIMRWLIKPDFKSIPLGTFTWLSFIGTAVVFGLEHFRIIPGIMAGVIYGLLVLHQKSIKGAVVAHAVTNFGLGIYVIVTGNWQFW